MILDNVFKLGFIKRLLAKSAIAYVNNTEPGYTYTGSSETSETPEPVIEIYNLFPKNPLLNIYAHKILKPFEYRILNNKVPHLDILVSGSFREDIENTEESSSTGSYGSREYKADPSDPSDPSGSTCPVLHRLEGHNSTITPLSDNTVVIHTGPMHWSRLFVLVSYWSRYLVTVFRK